MSQQQSIVSVYRLQALARALLPRERVASCCRAMVPGAPFVDIFRLPQHAAARYGNLIRCASYWTCPVCARKIAARRALELAALLDAHEAAGGVAAMLTLT
ncbi:MAG: hypothetical protein N2385_14595, partial [Chloroflexus sp.]|nr:hypothetical protein [Chloroflexus sp.]